MISIPAKSLIQVLLIVDVWLQGPWSLLPMLFYLYIRLYEVDLQIEDALRRKIALSWLPPSSGELLSKKRTYGHPLFVVLV